MPKVKMEGFGHAMNNFNSEISLKFLYRSIIIFIYRERAQWVNLYLAR